jgi:mannosyltransferase OCH1-like enzyme
MAPRLLVQFWDDASAVPGDVQTCLESWAALEVAGFERMLFDDTSARHFIEDHFSARHVQAFDRCSHPAMRADYFRLCFMLRLGGLYVDADDEYQGSDVEPLIGSGQLWLQALCYDIASDSIVDVARALAGTAGTAGTERIFYVNNNPLIAGPGHPVIARALERSTTLLLATNEANRDIQSLTGPGNLTASLVAHAVEQDADGEARDFELLTSWDAVAVSKWPLDYRADGRNWRNWVRGDEKVGRL